MRRWLVLALRRPSEEDLERIRRGQEGAPLTYPGVGGTLRGSTPPGYRYERIEREIGTGDRGFEQAREQLRHWDAHRRAGIIVSAEGPVDEGTTVALAAPLPVGFAIGTCRIVAVVDREDRFGFAYGTLPVHAESGEELFMVERRDDTVVFRIEVFSRPRQIAARVGAPVARILQRRATRRYLDAMQLPDPR